jgi:hypothetical protein
MVFKEKGDSFEDPCWCRGRASLAAPLFPKHPRAASESLHGDTYHPEDNPLTAFCATTYNQKADSDIPPIPARVARLALRTYSSKQNPSGEVPI